MFMFYQGKQVDKFTAELFPGTSPVRVKLKQKVESSHNVFLPESERIVKAMFKADKGTEILLPKKWADKLVTLKYADIIG
jgi:hypothetical protein